MNPDEVIASLALRDLQKKELLREIVHMPAHEYYFSIFKSVTLVASLCLMIGMLRREGVNFWVYPLVGLALYIIGELARQRQRFNAFVELSEIEKSETNQTRLVASCQPSDSHDSP